MGDQELMIKYVNMNNLMFDKLVQWGARVPKREDGSYAVMPTGPMTAMITIDLDVTIKVRQTAEKMGVKILDKITVSDLLTSDGKIAGATGYSILDGKFYTVNAKAVVLATGSQNYRVGSMWSSGRGDGIAAAYRAGAEMRNVEFGNFAQLVENPQPFRSRLRRKLHVQQAGRACDEKLPHRPGAGHQRYGYRGVV